MRPVSEDDATVRDGSQREVTAAHLIARGQDLAVQLDAIKAGVNPAALVDAINEAQAELEAAEAEGALQPEARTITRAEVYAMIDYLGNVGAALNEETPQSYGGSTRV